MKDLNSSVLVRDRNFRIFWVGQTVSWMGSMVQSVAQGWLVWSLTHSTVQLVLTAVMVSLPQLLFSLPAGVVADRLDRRTLLLATQTLSLVPATLLGILAASHTVTPPLILVLAFLQGTINAVEVPARHSYLAGLVPRDELCRAVAVNAVSFNAARMVGPVVAGVMISALGIAPCFFLNALTYVTGIVTLLLLGRSAEATAPQRVRPLLPGDLREGILFVHNHAEMRWVLLLVALVSLLGIPFVPLLPVFADSLSVGATGLGAMSACAGGGSLLAAIVLTLHQKLQERKGGAESAALVFAASLLTFARSGSFQLSLFALFMAGGALVTFLALANAHLQQGCPDSMRGRVMGVYAAALLGMAPLGNALVGWFAATLGAPGALSLSATICLAVVAGTATTRWFGTLPTPAAS